MTLASHDQTEPVYGVPTLTHDQEIALIHAKLDELIRLTNLVVDNVKPALDAMAASPLGVMFGMRD